MRTPLLKSLLKVIGWVLLPISGCFCLLSVPAGMIGPGLVFGILSLVAIYLIRGAPRLTQLVDTFPKVTSQYEGDRAFTQTGGLRYGSGIGVVNFTMPFARLRVTRESIVITLSFLGLLRRSFTFPRSSIRRLRWRRILFSLGIQI